MGEIAYCSISELVAAFNQVLEREFSTVFFEGELSQISRAQSGHIYFSVKDEHSQISAVMWRGSTRTLSFVPEQGMAVLCQGRPNVYGKSGRLQVVVDRLELAGEGLLRKKFLELKARLEREGFFAADRKRRLPFFPKAVGVVTSSTGAVIHDIMIKLKERMPHLAVYLVDVRVQGEGAAREIAQAIDLLNRSGLVDVIIVGRGGGSLEDLWAFNEEEVVKAIFASRLPVVSGVGHETDISLSDLVAGVRAPTPTAAAEMVVPRREDLLDRIRQIERRLFDTERWFVPLGQQIDELNFALERWIGARVQEWRLRLSELDAKVRLLEPRNVITLLHTRLDGLELRMSAAVGRGVHEQRKLVHEMHARLLRALQPRKVAVLRSPLLQLQDRLVRAFSGCMRVAQHQIERMGSRLDAVAPYNVLRRGYAIVEVEGEIVRDVQQVNVNQQLRITLSQGGIRARVEEKIVGERCGSIAGAQDVALGN